MDAAMTIPLLQALDAGGALIVGGWRMTGGYSTLPAVVNMAWDDKAIWTGSRHIVLIAAKNGLIERLDAAAGFDLRHHPRRPRAPARLQGHPEVSSVEGRHAGQPR